LDKHLAITQAQEYLKQFQVDDNQYIIGVYQKGITIHNQQIRALNIFHCLHLLGTITKDTRVGIIGGGIAGLTFAAAALNSRIKVSLFEKDQVLLPLQTGCKTRFIHPNIYAWPATYSAVNKTSLPVLNWDAGNADIVAAKILDDFNSLRGFYEQRGLDFDNYYYQILDSGVITDVSRNAQGKWAVTTNKAFMACDVLIYAVGFGVEKSELENTKSYWRCTDISQEPESSEYLISGVGDGAFMDLITALVRNFDYDSVTKIIAERDFLIQSLEDSKKAFFTAVENEKSGGSPMEKDFMFKEFEGLRKRHHEHILPRLDIRDFPIVLHSRKPFEHIFDLSKVSMLNAFLVYLLREKFTYQSGEYAYDKKDRLFVLADGNYKHEGDLVFFRHGTNREKLISDIPGLQVKIAAAGLKKLQESTVRDGDIQKLWQEKDFDKRFEEAHYGDIPAVSGNALPCLETFARGLADQLRTIAPFGSIFRLTLHKVVGLNEKMYYQQITSYYGHPRKDGDSGFGRLFSWNTGSIGYSILKRKPLLILKKSNEAEYRQMLEHLALTGKEEDLVNSAKTSFLSLPLLAKISSTEAITNFVLYIDSENPDFFSEAVYNAILAASKSFVESFESLVSKAQIKRGAEQNPYINLNEDDKKLFGTISRHKPLTGESSTPYQNFAEKVKKGAIPEFVAFNSLL
jgi:hypothetical protein